MILKALHLIENFFNQGKKQKNVRFYSEEDISTILVLFLQVFAVTHNTTTTAHASYLTCLNPLSPSSDNITSLLAASQPSVGRHHLLLDLPALPPGIFLPSTSLAPAPTLTPNIAGMAVFLK